MVGREVEAPRHFLKVCTSDEALRGALPSRWEIQPPGFVMTTNVSAGEPGASPEGYRLELHRAGPVTRVAIIAEDGSVAASGLAAETADAFVYDRIETAQDHRRKGLGIAVMTALGAAKRSVASRQLLVATDDGRKLYERLGWTVLAPLATALIPER